MGENRFLILTIIRIFRIKLKLFSKRNLFLSKDFQRILKYYLIQILHSEYKEGMLFFLLSILLFQCVPVFFYFVHSCLILKEIVFFLTILC
jgi:hypothetical protein